jgi:cephalosporin hydroxylase
MTATHQKHGFIQADPELQHLEAAALHKKLEISIMSGHRANFAGFRGHNEHFDRIVERTARFDVGYEDQCSPTFYWDLFNSVYAFRDKLTRVIDLGVFMGGSSVILAGCAHEFNLQIDLIDIGSKYLHFGHERIRRIYPEMAEKVRLYNGDLPTYVRDVLLHEQGGCILVHHDGAHDFSQVIRDFCSLSYVKDQIHSVAIQDTNLRGQPDYSGAGRFVDAAVYAIFGFDMKFATMGTTFTADNKLMTTPNQYGGNYFLPDMPEGWFVPLSQNTFRYPHPTMPPPLEAFIDPAQR